MSTKKIKRLSEALAAGAAINPMTLDPNKMRNGSTYVNRTTPANQGYVQTAKNFVQGAKDQALRAGGAVLNAPLNVGAAPVRSMSNVLAGDDNNAKGGLVGWLNNKANNAQRDIMAMRRATSSDNAAINMTGVNPDALERYQNKIYLDNAKKQYEARQAAYDKLLQTNPIPSNTQTVKSNSPAGIPAAKVMAPVATPYEQKMVAKDWINTPSATPNAKPMARPEPEWGTLPAGAGLTVNNDNPRPIPIRPVASATPGASPQVMRTPSAVPPSNGSFMDSAKQKMLAARDYATNTYNSANNSVRQMINNKLQNDPTYFKRMGKNAAIAGGVVAGAAVGAMALNKMMSKVLANRTYRLQGCKNIQDVQKRTNCYNYVTNQAVKELQASKSTCKNAANPSACEHSIQVKIDQLLHKRASYYNNIPDVNNND